MKVNQERGLVSNELPSETWGKSLWFILFWTLLIAPFWIALLNELLIGPEIQMRERGMLRNDYVYWAGYAIMIAGPTLGLVINVLLKRKRWPFWAVGIGEIAAAIISLFLGSFVTMSAFYSA